MDSSRLDIEAANDAEGPLLIATLASHDTGRETAPHRHARGQAFGSLRGLLTISTDSGRWMVPATHAVWIPPHRLHGVVAHGPYVGWSAYVAEAACAELPAQPFTLRMSALLRAAVMRAADWDGGALDAARLRVAGVVLDEIRQAPREALGLSMPADPRLLRIASALVVAPADARSLAEWAGWAGISSRSASRRFLVETGFSFSDWRQRARVLQALEWLAAGKPVTAVALDLGYDNVSAFIAMFKRVLHTTPGRYFSEVAPSDDRDAGSWRPV